jgi:hypothetical protein
VQQEEAERNAEKRRREQAEEVVDNSEEEDEELPQEWAWSPSKGVGIASGELQPGPARAVIMEPENCPEPCETRNVTRVTEELGTLRVTVQGERIKATNKFVLVEPGEDLQLRLTGNRELEVMMYSLAKKQASYNAGLLEMGVGLNKARRGELAARGAGELAARG